MLKRKIRFSALTILFIFLSLVQVVAQMHGRVEIPVSVTTSNRVAENVAVEVYENGNLIQTLYTKPNGTAMVTLNLNKQCQIKFVKAGFISKFVEYNTIVPKDASDIIIPAEKFSIDLFEDKGDLSQKDAVTKAVARFVYNTTYEDFVFDENYSKQVKSELDQARREADELARQKDKARLDSLNKVWTDSLAKEKKRDSLMLVQNAKQEKARQDSIAKANAEAALKASLEAKEKARKDSIAKVEAENARLVELARQKATADSLAKAEADKKKKQEEEQARVLAEAREKARQDSINRAELAKAKQDSIAAVKAKAEEEALAKLKEKERKDSLAKAEAELKAHEKFIADSTAKADAEKAKQEALAKAEAQVREKARQDSISKADAAMKVRQKFVADSLAKADAEKAKQEALAKAETQAKEKERQDSISKADAAMKVRQKFVADSLAKADAEKAKQEALAKAEAQAKEKERQDSIAKADVAMKARQRFVTDSTAQANAEKARQETIAKVRAEAEEARQKHIADSTAKADAEKVRQDALAKAEEERQKKLAEDKARADSIALAVREQNAREDAERKAKIQAELDAKKALAAKSYSDAGNEKTKETPKPSTGVPKIVDSDYKEGITEETITEPNRTIERIVVKKDGSTINYQKISYNWGGVYYFKNTGNMTKTSFDQEIKYAKESFKE